MLSFFELLQTQPRVGTPPVGSEAEPLYLSVRQGDILLLSGYDCPRDEECECVADYLTRLKRKAAVVVCAGSVTGIAATLDPQASEFLCVNMEASCEENGIEEVLRPTLSGETATLRVVHKVY